mgnify:CR=1 FL=1
MITFTHTSGQMFATNTTLLEISLLIWYGLKYIRQSKEVQVRIYTLASIFLRKFTLRHLQMLF